MFAQRCRLLGIFVGLGMACFKHDGLDHFSGKPVDLQLIVDGPTAKLGFEIVVRDSF